MVTSSTALKAATSSHFLPRNEKVPTGLTPCASAIIILLFAFGQELYLVGVAACLVMAVGMGLTVSLVGLAAVAARRGTVRMVGPSSAAAHGVRTALGIMGAAAITGLGGLLFLSAWGGV